MFPYKYKFVQTKPSVFLQNLREDKNLIEVVWSDSAEDSVKYPIQFISDESVYEKVNIITDLYTETARMKARIYNLDSPLQFWTKNKKMIQTEAYRRFGKVNNYTLREVIYFICKEATAFSPVLSKCVYDHLLPECGGSVLDPFSGWGDRSIGALGSEKVIKYQGVDCNRDLIEGYNKIKSELDTDDKLTFTILPFEEFKTDELYDLIFTSPPFFDFEIYSESKLQSISGKKDYSDWFTNWMAPVLKKMISFLKPRGIIAIHIGSTFRSPNLHEDVKKYLLDEKCTYIQQIGCSVRGKRSISIWVFQNGT